MREIRFQNSWNNSRNLVFHLKKFHTDTIMKDQPVYYKYVRSIFDETDRSEV